MMEKLGPENGFPVYPAYKFGESIGVIIRKRVGLRQWRVVTFSEDSVKEWRTFA